MKHKKIEEENTEEVDIEFPVLNIKMVDIDKVVANDYNPNKVAPPEMKLLKHSIEEDGYTQPIVTYYDKENDQYIVVDGFHRYRCAKEYFHLKKVPIVTIDKNLSNRMASTIRHNRARRNPSNYRYVQNCFGFNFLWMDRRRNF